MQSTRLTQELRSLQVEISPRAVADLIRIRHGLLDRAGEQSAEKVRRHLERSIDRLGRRPTPGISSDNPRIRILGPTTYPYRIYFTIIDQTAIVLHIRHTSRRLPALDKL